MSNTDENRAFVADVAMRRGITLGHLRNDGGGELREIMRRLDEAIGNNPSAGRTQQISHCECAGCRAVRERERRSLFAESR